LKLLVDENLPPRLVQDFADLFPGSSHARAILPSSSDVALWKYAKREGFGILTKDKDFASLSIAWGAPPKVILLQTGNCSTAQIVRLVRNNAIRFSDFDKTRSEACSS